MKLKDFKSFGIINKNRMFKNAGALLADESPIYCSRLFCTRWNSTDVRVEKFLSCSKGETPYRV